MPQLRNVPRFFAVLALVTASLSPMAPVRHAEGQEAEALIGKLRELLQATETKMVIVPFPNSRSRILKADASSDFFLYIERGNLRGTEEMAEFYAALEAGDVATANDVFTRHSLISLRFSDYGFNGLGVPMMRQDGSGETILDRLYKNKEGVFGRADPDSDDKALYMEYLETILIPALEGGS